MEALKTNFTAATCLYICHKYMRGSKGGRYIFILLVEQVNIYIYIYIYMYIYT